MALHEGGHGLVVRLNFPSGTTQRTPSRILFMFFDRKTKEMLHFSMFSSKAVIPPRMTKRFVEHDRALDNFASKPSGSATHVIYAELRMITYEIEESTKPRILDFIQK